MANGKNKTKTQDVAPSAVTVTPVVAPVAPVAAALPALYTTFHMAAKFQIRPVELRRVLRSMVEYADGVHTAYRWQSLDDSDVQVQRIAQAIGQRSGQRQAAAAAAQARLAAAQATIDAQAKAAQAAAELAAKAAAAKPKSK